MIIGVEAFTSIDDSPLDASVKCLAEYSHDKISAEGIDLFNVDFEDFRPDNIQRIQDLL